MPLTSELKQQDRLSGTVSDRTLTVDARDLTNGDRAARRAAIAAIRRHCLETGFFYLEHAFDDPAVVDTLLGQMQRFFSLDDAHPVKQGANNAGKAGNYGWMPKFEEPAYQPGTIAHVESFDCGLEEHRAIDKTLEGQNVWPELPGFRESALAYWEAITKIGESVLEVLAEAAGLEPGFLKSRCDSQALNTMRLLHYPGSTVPLDASNVGISAHTDFECITLIWQDRPGLELTDIDGNWFDAPCHDGRLVVLLDDMLERWTNGVFRATGHRVRNTPWQRYSIVMFFAVNEDEIIAPLPRFVSDERPAAHPPVRQRDHIDAEIERAERNREAVQRS